MLMMGTNRSIIIEHLGKVLKLDSNAIAYVYCVYSQPQQTAANLMVSLLKQVVQQESTIDAEVKGIYDTYKALPSHPSLEEYVRVLKGQICHFSRVFILVDALDECSETGQTREKFVRHLQSLLPHIRLLVTSRQIPSIEATFANVPRMEIRALDEDVRIAVNARIDEEPLLKSYIEEDPVMSTTITDTIISKTNGMYVC